MIAMKYLVATTLLGLVASAQSQTLSDPLSVAKVTTTHKGLVINTFNDASTCSNSTELFLKRQGPNYDRNVQIFVQGWTSGKSVRATIDGCTNDGAGEVDGWQIEADVVSEVDADASAKSSGWRDIKDAQIVQIRLNVSGNAYVKTEGEWTGTLPTCLHPTSSQYRTSMGFDATTTAGQAMLQTLSDAHARKQLVSFYGKASCDVWGSLGIQDLNFVLLLQDVLDSPARANEVYAGAITELIAGNDGAEGFVLKMDVDGAQAPTSCASDLSYFSREQSNNFDAMVSLAIGALSMNRTVEVVAEAGYSGRCRIMQMTLQ